MGNCFSFTDKEDILLIGLENQGKTFLLFKHLVKLIKTQKLRTTPTFGFNYEIVEIAGKSLAVWDIPGKYVATDNWKMFSRCIAFSAIVYVIDYEKSILMDQSTLLKRYCDAAQNKRRRAV